ncbi:MULTISPECIES: LCP family protein [Jonquetella]|uniref:Cell envelope-related function transcriptional attenuator common domain protein n=1 Tax=Jonquetella anthropi DSM 22815 TaxID=885272 RepID=H0UKA0_9BACT|nr:MULTISPECIES: LCP family protein [Jonquetella]EEX48490.1 cell envelope-like function transcriptional attenuator common domain protein [Jonquetella anthropi E3_33 E1]EHM13109.1 cell envelope-related function transcriptional attenuator common domain protein [Jonquetella anthropi DSM 22815]ERL23866.1 hypothetical protein HMPREF1249_0378 [Jonquetella sp. BV3C21]
MKRWFLVLLVILLAVAAAALGVVARLYKLAHVDVSDLKQHLKIEQLMGSANFLIVGIDQLDRIHRSDAILLVKVNLDKKTVKAMSIPRDTRVQLGRHGIQKINAAYAFGGIELLKDTVTNLTGVPINHTVILNYESFPQLIDAIGGVDIDVPKKMVYTDRAQGLYINFMPGMQHMDGEAALKFCRFRKDALGDEGRMKRQQQFIKAALAKVKSPAVIVRLPDIALSAMKFIKTDLPTETALQLALYMKDLDANRIELFTMPGVAAYIKNLSYWIPDLQKASIKFSDTPEEEPAQAAGKAPDGQQPAVQNPGQEGAAAAGQPSPEDVAKLEELRKTMTKPLGVLNGAGQAGISRKTATLLERLGLSVGYTGNAKHYGYQFSVVHYPKGPKPKEAVLLASLCKIPDNLVIGTSVPQLSLVLGKDYEKIYGILEKLPIKR